MEELFRNYEKKLNKLLYLKLEIKNFENVDNKIIDLYNYPTTNYFKSNRHHFERLYNFIKKQDKRLRRIERLTGLKKDLIVYLIVTTTIRSFRTTPVNFSCIKLDS